jgi:hypothetical protein
MTRRCKGAFVEGTGAQLLWQDDDGAIAVDPRADELELTAVSRNDAKTQRTIA